MNFNTYVINLKNDTKKWDIMKKNFKSTDLHLIRFDAIDGKHISPEILEQYVAPLCRTFCSRSAIGCGVSHVILAEHFLEKDPFDFCLILEDDMIPLYTNLATKINQCVDQMKSVDWDIIKLYCSGMCFYNNKKITKTDKMKHRSTGAYLLSLKGAQKIAKFTVDDHIDKQFEYSNLSIYLNKYPLFETYFDYTSTSKTNSLMKYLFDFKITEHSPPFWYTLGMKQYYIPYIDTDITKLHIICIVFLFIIMILYYITYGSKQSTNDRSIQ